MYCDVCIFGVKCPLVFNLGRCDNESLLCRKWLVGVLFTKSVSKIKLYGFGVTEDCYLTPSEQLFLAILWREQATF